MIEFLKNMPNLEALFRHFLPNTLVRVKRIDFPPEFSDYGMMRVVSVILHKNESVIFGFTPAESTDPDDIHYYDLSQIEISFDVSEEQSREINKRYGHSFTFVAPGIPALQSNC